MDKTESAFYKIDDLNKQIQVLIKHRDGIIAAVQADENWDAIELEMVYLNWVEKGRGAVPKGIIRKLA